MKLSATRLKTYLTCPRQFRYVYVDEIPRVLTGPLAFGQVIHETIHRLHVHSLETVEPLDIAYGTQQFATLWHDVLQQEQPFFKDGEAMVRQYRDLAEGMIEGYVNRHKDAAPPLVLEFPFQLPWEEHLIEGIIDRIDEGEHGLIIVDFKTAKRKPGERDLRSDLQLTLYAFAVEHLLEEPVERLVYYHLRDHTPLLTTRSDSDFRRLVEDLLPSVVQAIEERRFEPHFGFWCRYCDFRELCAAEGPDELPLPEQPGDLSPTAIPGGTPEKEG